MLSSTPAGPTPPAEKYTLGRPTDVGWDAQGNIFVSDGYVNHRVVKYDKNGRFLKQVGSERPGSEPSQFNLPHGLAVDAQGNVYVADRAQQPDAGVRQQPRPQRDLRQHRHVLDASASRRVRISICSPPTPTRTATVRASWDNTGEIYKMELDGTILGASDTRARNSAGFRSCT